MPAGLLPADVAPIFPTVAAAAGQAAAAGRAGAWAAANTAAAAGLAAAGSHGWADHACLLPGALRYLYPLLHAIPQPREERL